MGTDTIEILGSFLSYGTIGLGLAVAVLTAFTLSRDDLNAAAHRSISRFMIFGITLVIVGASIEVWRSAQSAAQSDRSLMLSQNLPDEFWNDFLVGRQQIIFGTAAPTDQEARGRIENNAPYTYDVNIGSTECQHYFVAVKPPSGVNVSFSDNVVVSPGIVRDYYKTGTICRKGESDTPSTPMKINVIGLSSQFSAKFFVAKSTTEQSANNPDPPITPQAPPVSAVACIGEREANCAGPHDIFRQCGTDISTIGDELCPREFSLLRLNVKSGNQCGYSLTKITCQ